MKKDSKEYLLHILDAIQDVKDYSKDPAVTKLHNGRLLIDAVCYKMQIIGEAAKKLPKEIRNEINSPWDQIIAMRNIIVHDYADLNVDIIWETITKDLSSLEKAIKTYLNPKS